MPRDKDLPLSFAQQRLWFLNELEPGSAVYNCPAAVRFGGALNTSRAMRIPAAALDPYVLLGR